MKKKKTWEHTTQDAIDRDNKIRSALIKEIEEKVEKLPVGYDRDFNDTGINKQEVLSILTNLREEEK